MEFLCIFTLFSDICTFIECGVQKQVYYHLILQLTRAATDPEKDSLRKKKSGVFKKFN